MNARKNCLYGLMILLAALLIAAALPMAGHAQTQVTPNIGPPLTGTTTVVNNGPGDHTSLIFECKEEHT